MKKGNGDIFKVDRKTGDIFLKQNVDEHNTNLSIVITAYDGAVSPCFTDVLVNIKVVDKSMPIFAKQFYAITVKEDVQLYTAISLSIKVVSPLNRELIFTIAEGNNDELFEVDYKSGLIYVINNLDYELKPSHDIKIRATDSVSGIYAEVAVSISVEDVNDCYPEIEKDNYNITLTENLLIGSEILQIVATDNDSKANGDLSYSIKSVNQNNINDIFYLDIMDGTLYLKNILDYENISSYHLVIIVSDHGTPSLSSKTNVWITVEDFNDNIPQFIDASFSCKLSTNAIRGQFVTMTKAYDLDVMDNNKLVYKIIEGNNKQIYSIEKNTGVILLNSLHSFVENHQTILNVSVTDGIYTTFSRVKIMINSDNSNHPSCRKAINEAVIMENKKPGQKILILSAVDDFEKFPKFTFEIISREMDEFFVISKTNGSIYTKVSFDREKRIYYDFFVKVTDVGGKFGFCMVKIEIADENDNLPSFKLKEYKTTVKLNTTLNTTILRIKAFDLDNNKNGYIKYMLNNDGMQKNLDEYFFINELDGSLLLIQNPTKWTNTLLQFFIRAYDIGVPQLHNDIPISIQFVNNDVEIPIFEKSLINLKTLESTSPGSILTKLKNSGNYSKIYSIETENSVFSISDGGEIILMESLDREIQSIHYITVSCETVTNPVMYAQAEIYIHVQDENDNYPIFNADVYTVEIPENIDKGTPILKVSAFDNDIGSNGDVRYYIDNNIEFSSNIFDVDIYSGWITLLTYLDRETQSEYYFNIFATDNGFPKHISKVPIVVKILDYNDNPSIFENQIYEEFIFENVLPGTVVTNLILTDLDSKINEIDFHIISGDSQAQFHIRPSGELFVSKPLDREIIPIYNLTLLATDGKFTSLSNIIIHIKDVNDNFPVCSNPRYNLIVNESISIGTQIIKIIATDSDEYGTVKLRYYLSGNNSDNFSIGKDTGLLTVAKSIDREQNTKFLLNVHVQDGDDLLHECVSEIQIKVLDLNDNVPEFAMKQYIVSVYENAPLQSVITKVHATDRDIGINRKILYNFNEKNKFFNISRQTGIIKLTQNLDRENIPFFNISIRAEDCGKPTLYSNANLIINILDINDNPPIFGSTEYKSYLLENSSLYSEVLRVFASSKDIGVNAEIMYYITAGNEQKHFNMNSTNGVLYVNDKLDYEKIKTYYLTVQAVDGGTPPLTSLTSLNISIVDVNDNTPTFSQNLYRANVKEDITIGEQIIRILATDDDSDKNGLIKYSIEKGNHYEHFNIEQLQGIISTLIKLDREIVPSYILKVKACDSGLPELCNYINVYIDVLDLNDNPPMFSSSNYTVILQEHKELGYPILKFNVSDADEYPNAYPFTFDIRSGNNGGFFRLGSDGILRTASKLNHKLCNLYNLQVRVFDNGTPPLYSDTWINIYLVQESQHAPIITPLEIFVNSYEDDFAGGLLGKIYASDQDKYDSLTFSLNSVAGESYQINKYFQITEETGLLYAISPLDIGIYRVNVTVSDGKFITNTIIKVNIELISSDMFKNSVILRFNKVSAKDFIMSYRKIFVRYIASVNYCRQNDVIILSLSNKVNERNSTKRVDNNLSNELNRNISYNNLNLVLAIRNQQTNHIANFLKPEEIYNNLINKIEEIEEGTNLVLEEIREPTCLKNKCFNGKCINQLLLHKNYFSTFYTDVVSFVVPIYEEISICQCKVGFDGKLCERVVNKCSSDPCESPKYCMPTNTSKGYQCICPKGSAGKNCNIQIKNCFNNSCGISNAAVSFTGKSFAHYKINKSFAKTTLENQFHYALRIRTIQQTGSIFYASGKIDYNILEIVGGNLKYRFDLGSGEGSIRVSNVYISDGQWHSIVLERILNNAKLSIDGKHFSQGSAPGLSEIFNTQTSDFFVGAEVRPHPTIIGFEDIQKGFIGCMTDIKISFELLPLYIPGGSSIASLKRFNNVEFSCDDTDIIIKLGKCGSQPCLNGGECSNVKNNDFLCNCHSRFSGKLCEIDLDPCASSPCLYGGRCVNKYLGNYSCICPLQLSGIRCEYGKFCTPNPCRNGGVCEEGDEFSHCICHGYEGLLCEIDVNECKNHPCGNGATCLNEPGSFRCICPSYLTGANCGDPLYSNSISTKLKNLSLEQITGIIAGISIIFIIVIISLCVIILKKQTGITRNSLSNLKTNNNEHNINALKEKGKFKKYNMKLSNLQTEHCPSNNIPDDINDTIYNGAFLNNLDILRNYGSAGDELERIPFQYQKINQTNLQTNINCSYTDREFINKYDLCEQKQLITFSENKLYNGKVFDNRIPANQVSSVNYVHGKVIQMTIPNLCEPILQDYSANNQGLNHWDCSDWNRKSQNPLPDITEIPGIEILDSSSFQSNESNESAHKNCSNKNILGTSSLKGKSDLSIHLCDIEDSE